MGTPDRRCSVWYDKDRQWASELRAIRAILMETPLVEAFKWRHPIYTFDGGNVAGIEGYKAGFGVAFFKGVLLDDPDGLLTSPGPNSHHAKRLALTDFDQIAPMREALLGFVAQAIELEKQGRKVEAKAPPMDHPEELTAALDADPALAEAFHALTPGRQRSWLLHFNGAKQSATRSSRIEKATPKILSGKGMHDR